MRDEAAAMQIRATASAEIAGRKMVRELAGVLGIAFMAVE